MISFHTATQPTRVVVTHRPGTNTAYRYEISPHGIDIRTCCQNVGSSFLT